MKRILITMLLCASILSLAGLTRHTFARADAKGNEAKSVHEATRTPGADRARKRKAQPPPSFKPSERVPVDMAVDFPADI